MTAIPEVNLPPQFDLEPEEERYGYINLQGEWIVPPILKSDYDYSEGYISVDIDPKIGLLNAQGDYLLRPEQIPHPFTCYVDRQGQLAFGGKLFREGGSFDEGVAPAMPTYQPLTVDMLAEERVASVTDWPYELGRVQGKCGYIDKTGEFVIEPQFDLCQNFSGGIAPFLQKSSSFTWGKKWGYIDRQGRVIVEPQFDIVGAFEGDMAKVQVIGELDDDGNTIGPEGINIVNRSGHLLLSRLTLHEDFCEFWEGLAIVRLNGKWGAINSEGEIVIEPKYDKLRGYSEGYGTYTLRDQEGYIRSDGTEIAPPPFEGFDVFSEGLAAVWTNGKFGFVNEDYELVIETQFDMVGNFSEGRAAVYPNGKCGVGNCGYINRQGELVIPCDYQYGDPFIGGAARVILCIEGKDYEGHINREGEWISPPVFSLVGPFSEGIAWVEVGQKRIIG